MRSGHVYPALFRALEDWRSRPSGVLAASVGAPPEVAELQLGGELIRIETSASWADAERATVLIEAVAFGSASWLTERVVERACIELRPTKGGEA